MGKFPKLIDDCLRNIFEYLKNDQRTLHSCVLVNRQWCQNAIPVFWGNPWEYRREGLKNSFTIINTYISTLPKETQQTLLQDGIIQRSLLKKPIFEYSKFLQSIVLHELENDIKIWIYNQQIMMESPSKVKQQRKKKGAKNFTKMINIGENYQGQNFKRNKKNLMYELLKFFLIHSSKIDALYISDFNFSFIMEIIKREPVAKNCIANLRHLQIGAHILLTCLSKLSQISRNVEHLEIENRNFCIEELNFINVQNNLKELTVEICRIEPNIDHNILVEISRKKSINKLNIRDSPEMFFILKGFENLTELIIICTMKFSKRCWEHMANVSLRNLKKLIIDSNTIYYDIITQFIYNSSCDLEHIIITTSSRIEDPHGIGLYINSISNNCPSLTIFKGVIHESNVSEFSQLLRRCANLKVLHLYPVMRDSTQKMCQFDNLMKEMINISSNNLSRLYLENGWKLMIVECFKSFIKKRKSLGLKPISFYAHNNFTCNNYSTFLNICEDYKQIDYLLDYHFYN